jgi:hypothetical protein
MQVRFLRTPANGKTTRHKVKTLWKKWVMEIHRNMKHNTFKQ